MSKLEMRRSINNRLKNIELELSVAKIMKADDVVEELYEEKRVLLTKRTQTY